MANSILYLNWSVLTEEINTVLKEFPADCQQALREIDKFQKRIVQSGIRTYRQFYVIKITDVRQKSLHSFEQRIILRQLVRQGIFSILQTIDTLICE